MSLIIGFQFKCVQFDQLSDKTSTTGGSWQWVRCNLYATSPLIAISYHATRRQVQHSFSFCVERMYAGEWWWLFQAFSDHLDMVSRRMGFIPLPLAVLLVRVVVHSIRLKGAFSYLLLLLFYLWYVNIWQAISYIHVFELVTCNLMTPCDGKDH